MVSDTVRFFALMWFLLPALISFLLTFWWRSKIRFKRTIENVPTSKVQGVFIGMNEVKGKAEIERPLTTYLAEVDAVWFHYSIEEHWRRTVTYTDSEGKTKTRTESGWKTVDSGGDLAFFDLRDDTGSILIDGTGADIDGNVVFSETCGRSDPLYYGKGPPGGVSDSTGRRRFTEQAIRPGDQLYILGSAQVRDDIAAPFIGNDDRDPYFVISVRSEERIVSGASLAAGFIMFFGALLAAAAPVVWAAEHAPDEIRPPREFQRSDHFAQEEEASVGKLIMHNVDKIALGLGAFFGVLFLMYLQLLYNGLVRTRNRLDRALSLIDVQLKRRHDLIPSLVNVVKGLAGHESGLQEHLAHLRGVGARQVVTSGLMALKEAYPEVTSQDAFKQLFDQIKDAEDRIALARGFYNDSLNVLRDRLQTFPDVLVARLFGFKPGKPLPPLQEFERAVPDVSRPPPRAGGRD